jgi:hypothetical protein
MVNEPSCEHPRRGIVTTAPNGYKGGAHAATNCCDRPECVKDAARWARNLTGLDATFVPDRRR